MKLRNRLDIESVRSYGRLDGHDSRLESISYMRTAGKTYIRFVMTRMKDLTKVGEIAETTTQLDLYVHDAGSPLATHSIDMGPLPITWNTNVFRVTISYLPD